MSKEDFLKELEDRLKVLDYRERQDMLSEYSQHIDMKVRSGMEEKEAIEDFGDIDSLAQEILEAYHIDPDYRVLEENQPEKKERRVGKKARKAVEKASESISGFLEQRKIHKEEKRSTKKEKQDKSGSGLVNDTGFGFKKSSPVPTPWTKRRKKWHKEVWKWMKWILRMCIKAILIVITIPVVVVDVLAVFALGVLLILLLQGYPLIGVTIGICGAVLCCSAYSLLVFSYVVERKRENSGREVEV